MGTRGRWPALCAALLLLCGLAGAEEGDLGGLRPPWFRPPSVFDAAWAGWPSRGLLAGLLPRAGVWEAGGALVGFYEQLNA
jgi:hypothetical protein